MNLLEHTAKAILQKNGISVPSGRLAYNPSQAAKFAKAYGSCALKAQIPSGGRGKTGAVRFAETENEAEAAANDLIGVTIKGHANLSVLVEKRLEIKHECYAAYVADAASRGPMLLFSPTGGVHIETNSADASDSLVRLPIDIRSGPDIDQIRRLLEGFDLGDSVAQLTETLCALYRIFRHCDAELLEINPLAILPDNSISALDCKFSIDDSSAQRQPELRALAAAEPKSKLELTAERAGLKFIQLSGDVGVLANGAGLTMASVDAIAHAGGCGANFLEIGGESYTKAKSALEIVLANPGVKSLLVNFCGAFARTDVMAEGVAEAWLELNPSIPVFFAVNGTGAEEAVALLRQRLGIEPYRTMNEAVEAAVAAAANAVSS